MMQCIQNHNRINEPIEGKYYKIFIVLSKDRLADITKKIANLPKKDTITYIQEEFLKSRTHCMTKIATKSDKSF